MKCFKRKFPFEKRLLVGLITLSLLSTCTGCNIFKSSGKNSGSFEGPADTWTIFVYLCGSNLESKSGSASKDIEEMQAAVGSEDVRFVVQTGGSLKWSNSMIDSNQNQRFVVKSGVIEKVDEQPYQDMGKSDTFADFLKWGTKNYPSEHMGVVLWNHGGGSISGVCFDETQKLDSLSLMELDSALASCKNKIDRNFDFIGFDACLMGSIETANILSNYADYMIASEESEPTSGWDFAAIGKYLIDNPDADGAELGKEICDSYLAACNNAPTATLSVIDLSKMDALVKSFDSFSQTMYEAGAEPSQMADMVRGISSADNFGGNNKYEGYSNMVDMGGVLDACEPYAKGAKNAKSALEDAIVYSVCGSTHKTASGLSIYYPLSIQGSDELTVFSNICVSPYYLSFVDRNNHNATKKSMTKKDEEQWIEGNDVDQDYWNYLDSYEQSGASELITFAEEPQLDENGSYWFQLDVSGYNNLSAVHTSVYYPVEDGTQNLFLGETAEFNADWDSGTYWDNFTGKWLSLPDGQNLYVYLTIQTDEYVIYTVPINLNGERTNLRLRQYYSGEVVIEGVWDGIEDCGAASRIYNLKDGDVITPVYLANTNESDEVYEYIGDDYVVSGDTEITYRQMLPGEYFYAFTLYDIYGDYYMTDSASFSVYEDGSLTFTPKEN
ncbi:MAG: Clostripain family protein [Pseudobutyrivibrio sp.]|nr:Clostripain family protein [Pseudobutyrivibrio sp.]